MSLHIILRTVCGCERIVLVNRRNYPQDYKVPFIRRKNFLLTGSDEDTRMPTYQTRMFEQTSQTGQYGYPIYVEVL
jgi:hypothetical protein